MYSSLSKQEQACYNVIDAAFITYKISRRDFVKILGMLIQKYRERLVKQ